LGKVAYNDYKSLLFTGTSKRGASQLQPLWTRSIGGKQLSMGHTTGCHRHAIILAEALRPASKILGTLLKANGYLMSIQYQVSSKQSTKGPNAKFPPKFS